MDTLAGSRTECCFSKISGSGETAVVSSCTKGGGGILTRVAPAAPLIFGGGGKSITTVGKTGDEVGDVRDVLSLTVLLPPKLSPNRNSPPSAKSANAAKSVPEGGADGKTGILSVVTCRRGGGGRRGGGRGSEMSS